MIPLCPEMRVLKCLLKHNNNVLNSRQVLSYIQRRKRGDKENYMTVCYMGPCMIVGENGRIQ
jgi:hypothetical protein